ADASGDRHLDALKSSRVKSASSPIQGFPGRASLKEVKHGVSDACSRGRSEETKPGRGGQNGVAARRQAAAGLLAAHRGGRALHHVVHGDDGGGGSAQRCRSRTRPPAAPASTLAGRASSTER